ncbi:hypothetical protein BDA96_02G437300 [Sorghum bicolor]|uniref:Uncharacterized protein n=1 Tax=Sorghum bicolor TaxID=4558 RepID=A0A921RUB3_SORBI|nr:hypothetical protein BDA96_02G437300 [Sorghum bicolor]
MVCVPLQQPTLHGCLSSQLQCSIILPFCLSITISPYQYATSPLMIDEYVDRRRAKNYEDHMHIPSHVRMWTDEYS